MTDTNTSANSDRALPLTDRADTSGSQESINETMIRHLVDTFYEDIRVDALLGPIFAHHVADWSLHLPKMYNFWSTVVLRTGRYSGRPLEAHERIAGLTQAHFTRWLELWNEVVRRIIPSAAQTPFIVAADRMALSMASRIVA